VGGGGETSAPGARGAVKQTGAARRARRTREPDSEFGRSRARCPPLTRPRRIGRSGEALNPKQKNKQSYNHPQAAGHPRVSQSVAGARAPSATNGGEQASCIRFTEQLMVIRRSDAWNCLESVPLPLVALAVRSLASDINFSFFHLALRTPTAHAFRNRREGVGAEGNGMGAQLATWRGSRVTPFLLEIRV